MKFPKYLIVFFFLLCAVSCRQVKDLVTNLSPRESFIASLESSDLGKKSFVTNWQQAWQRALSNPVTIDIPYNEKTIFFPNEADAAAFKFIARRGEIINIQINAGFSIFAELFEAAGINSKAIATLEENQSSIEFEVDETTEYVLAIQPELLSGGNCEIIIRSEPSVPFPVSGRNATDIKSFWGAGRDGGSRKHEGVDIFAARGTPVVAVAPGVVRSGNNNLGGKVMWLSQPGKGRSFYYAHLDSQLVNTGIVKPGDTLGFVGNTGNAKFTPPHLHFGIYYFGGGAVDPFPFINDVNDEVKTIIADTSFIGQYAVIANSAANVRSRPSTNAAIDTSLSQNNAFKIKSATADWYRTEFPDGKTAFIHSSVVAAADKTIELSPEGRYLAWIPPLKSPLFPDSIPVENETPIIGKYANYNLIKHQSGNHLWISR